MEGRKNRKRREEKRKGKQTSSLCIRHPWLGVGRETRDFFSNVGDKKGNWKGILYSSGFVF